MLYQPPELICALVEAKNFSGGHANMVKTLLIGFTVIVYFIFFSLVRTASLADERLEEIKRQEEIHKYMEIVESIHEQK